MRLLIPFLLLASPAFSNPKVVTDIAPLHSIVASVMKGAGEPDLLLPPNANPHHFSMRPSQARSLSKADIVFWIGQELTPWLEEPLEELAGGKTVSMMDHAATLPFRGEHNDHEDHDEHADHDEHDDHEGHADHDEHDDHEGDKAHDDHDDHADDTHDDDPHSGHDHAEGSADPHVWLDPRIAANWPTVIASKLSEVDPDNASTYFQNANALQTQITALYDQSSEWLKALDEPHYIADHDSFQYFDAAFGTELKGAITLAEDAPPSAAHLDELIKDAKQDHVHCIILSEAPTSMAEMVTDATKLSTSTADPLGATLEPGPDFYVALIGQITQSFENCLGNK